MPIWKFHASIQMSMHLRCAVAAVAVASSVGQQLLASNVQVSACDVQLWACDSVVVPDL